MKLKNKKLEALFREITGLELILICIPFFLSIFVSQHTIVKYMLEYEEQQAYVIVLYGFLFILSFIFLYLIGVRWRIIYFCVLLFFAIYLLIELGRPEEYYKWCDRDNAIKVGIRAILKGDYPYYKRTDLDNPISPLPFTFFFYIPIYLLTGGYIFHMTIIVFFVFISILFYMFMDTKNDYLILPVISFTIFSEWFFLEVIINSDIHCTMFLLCIILFLVPDIAPEQREILNFFSIMPKIPLKIDFKITLFSILFGCLLAMRIYFWLIGIVIFIYIYRNYGFLRTILLVLITLGVFFSWILPFYLYDPEYFMEEVLKGGNAYKFTEWRTYRKVHPHGHLILDFLNETYHYGEDNSLYISYTIILSSAILGSIKLQSKFNLLIIISFCYLLLLFFIFHGHTYIYMKDYVSLAAIPFIFSFIYSREERYD